jgi:DNA-binding CsgD family transcriptional regulator
MGRRFGLASRSSRIWYSRRRPPTVLGELTPAEREVLALVCEGRSNKEIAACRGTSVNTVGNPLAAIFSKLAVANRFELVELADTRHRLQGAQFVGVISMDCTSKRAPVSAEMRIDCQSRVFGSIAYRRCPLGVVFVKVSDWCPSLD